MLGSKKERCIADIKYTEEVKGVVETCIDCPKCPGANFIERLSTGTTRAAKQFAKDRASVIIENNCII